MPPLINAKEEHHLTNYCKNIKINLFLNKKSGWLSLCLYNLTLIAGYFKNCCCSLYVPLSFSSEGYTKMKNYNSWTFTNKNVIETQGLEE